MARTQHTRTRGFCSPSRRLFPSQEELILVQTQTFDGAAGSGAARGSGRDGVPSGAVAGSQLWGPCTQGPVLLILAWVQGAGGGESPPPLALGAPPATACGMLRNARAGWGQ